MTPRWDLRPLLAPRSIAVVGASESPDSWAPEIERSLRHLGYTGSLYPINPKYDTVWGLPCLSSICELPRGVDLVVFVVPAPVVVRMLEDCGERGVRGVMVVSSGFAEAGDEGRALQEQLRASALRLRIPVLGPNVEGFVNYIDHVAPYGTTPPPEPLAGGISVLSQSGTVAWTMNQLASDRAVGLRIILGVGNEAVLGLGDLFAWAAADPATKVVTSYIETMRDVDGIGRGLDALLAARKPVLICAPQGRSEAVRRAIVAHTGALAGNTALRDAWLEGRGAVLVDDPVTMFEAAVLLSHTRRVRGGVAAALQSGGACTLFAESAGAAGLPLPDFAPATKRTLRRRLPSFASQNNPLDVTGQAAVETDMFVGALEALARDPSVGLVAFDAFPPRLPGELPWADPVLAEAVRLRKETGVVFASVSMSPLAYGSDAKTFVRRWRALPFLQGHRAATGAIQALLELQRVRDRAVRPMPAHVGRRAALRLVRGVEGPLDEAAAARILEFYGVRRPPEEVVPSPARAAAAAARLGGPVAVKALAPELPHKARLGGVRLGLRRKADVEAAAAEVLSAARRAGAAAPKVLVQRMAEGTEVLVGALVDARFGACVTMRPGGALAEAGAASFVAAPLTARQAMAYVEMHAEGCGLDPHRHDLRALAAAVASIGRAAHDLRDRLASLEANPLLVGRRGAVAVDALAEVRAPA